MRPKYGAYALICVGILIVPTQTRANSALCEVASRNAARAHNIPENVLRAITLTETGRRADAALQPWPWTVNMEGTGRWFETQEQAMAYVYENHARGARSYDVGCFQLNWRWHGANFSSLDEMFEPQTNADYAAQYLAGHFAELGTWEAAAGRYHSGTPEYATRYSARFSEILARLGDAPNAIYDPQSLRTARIQIPFPAGSGSLFTRASASSGPLFQTSSRPLIGN